MNLQAEKLEYTAVESKQRKSTVSSIALLTISDCPKEEKAAITMCVAKHVWKLLGFMPENPAVQEGSMGFVYRNMDPHPPKEVISESNWVKSCLNIVCSVMNQNRGYISANL